MASVAARIALEPSPRAGEALPRDPPAQSPARPVPPGTATWTPGSRPFCAPRCTPVVPLRQAPAAAAESRGPPPRQRPRRLAVLMGGQGCQGGCALWRP